MIDYPPAVTWLAAAAAAIAVGAPGRWVMLAIVPFTAAVVAVTTARRRPPQIKPPESPFVVGVALKVRLDINAGSMDRDAEARWRARYDIPPGLPQGGWVSGAMTDTDPGAWGPQAGPRRPPTLEAELEQLERLANTGELEVLRP